MASLKDQFLLRPDIHFLNFGSFGATPKPIFEKYQDWQRVLEAEPVQFIAFDGYQYLADSRAALAKGDFAEYDKAQKRLKSALDAAINAQGK